MKGVKLVARALRYGLLYILWYALWVVAIVFFGWQSVVVTSYLTARHYAPGETPQHMFYVALQPGVDGAGFEIADLRHLEKGKGSFLLPRAQDEHVFRGQQWSYASYRVLEDTPAGQLIEVYRQDDDYYFWTRYRATRDTVMPVYSRVIGPALGIIAMPFGLIFAYFAVRLLQRASARAWQRWGWAQEKEAPP